jgi:polar amino acid transport system substrate-binding protein
MKLLLAALLLAANVGAGAQSAGTAYRDPAAPPPHPPRAESATVTRAPAADQLATIRQRGQLRVGVVPVVPMVMRAPSGDWAGFSIDLAKQLASDLGVEAVFVPSTWPEVVPDLLSQQYDVIITGLWVTVPRALVLNFTAPTAIEDVQLVASRRAAPGLKSVADANRAGLTVAVGAGTAEVALAQRLLPRATLLATDTDPLTAVISGKAQLALLPTLSHRALQQVSGNSVYLPLSLPLASTQAAMGIRKGDPDFLAFLNTWISLQRQRGWLDERLTYWSLNPEPR